MSTIQPEGLLTAKPFQSAAPESRLPISGCPTDDFSALPHAQPVLHLPRIFKNAGANLLRLGSAWIVLMVVTPLLTRWMRP